MQPDKEYPGRRCANGASGPWKETFSGAMLFCHWTPELCLRKRNLIWLCAHVAEIWNWENRRCDAESQYPFSDHVPVVRRLEGGQALLHEMLVYKLLLIRKSNIR